MLLAFLKVLFQGSNDIVDVKMFPKLSTISKWEQSLLPLHFLSEIIRSKSSALFPNRFLDTKVV